MGAEPSGHNENSWPPSLAAQDEQGQVIREGVSLGEGRHISEDGRLQVPRRSLKQGRQTIFAIEGVIGGQCLGKPIREKDQAVAGFKRSLAEFQGFPETGGTEPDPQSLRMQAHDSAISTAQEGRWMSRPHEPELPCPRLIGAVGQGEEEPATVALAPDGIQAVGHLNGIEGLFVEG